MDDQGEDCIAVGSTGTLLALMGKEMEILQARRSSCSVSNTYKTSPSAKEPSTLYVNASNIGGSPAPMKPSPSSASLVSSLWSDLKGLLRSPTCSHLQQQPSPLPYSHNNFAHSPLLYPINPAHFSPELEICHEEDSAALCHHPSPSHASSPLRALLSYSPKRTYPKKGAPLRISQQFTRPSSSTGVYPPEGFYPCSSQKPSRATYPKEKVSTAAILYLKHKSSLDSDHGCLMKQADYPHGKSALHFHPKERLAAEAAPYPNRKYSPLHYYSQADQRSSAMSNAFANRKDVKFTPTGIDQEARKSVAASAAAANPNLQGKAMDHASNPNLQFPKAKAMDAVYAMRRRLGRIYGEYPDSQNGKLLQQEEVEGSARITSCRNRKREERAICSMEERSEERESMQNEYMQKSEERECMQDECSCGMQRGEEEDQRGSCMIVQELYECTCMQKLPMLQDMEAGPPAASSSACSPACFKPSRSFGGRSTLPRVSVVDLHCCHTPTSRERSSSRLSFTRLLSTF